MQYKFISVLLILLTFLVFSKTSFAIVVINENVGPGGFNLGQDVVNGAVILCETTVNAAGTDCNPLTDRSDVVKFTTVAVNGTNVGHVDYMSDLTVGEAAPDPADRNAFGIAGLAKIAFLETPPGAFSYAPTGALPGGALPGDPAISYSIVSDCPDVAGGQNAPVAPEQNTCTVCGGCSMPEPPLIGVFVSCALVLSAMIFRKSARETYAADRA